MKTIICIPGLGGRANLFDGYKSLLPEYNLEIVDLIDWKKTQAEVDELVARHADAIILCNCYGSHIALRSIEKMPERVSALIVVEPFFSQLFFWRHIASPLNKILVALSRITDKMGLKRKTFKIVNYGMVEKEPLWKQILLDWEHQSMTDYLTKLEDITTFKIPENISTKTLLLFSPSGFTPNPKIRKLMQSFFKQCDIAVLNNKKHTIMTLASDEIVSNMKNWLEKTN